jgi:hypothetical protein
MSSSRPRPATPTLTGTRASSPASDATSRAAREGAQRGWVGERRAVVPLITTDVAVLNHPTIGPRLRVQNHQLQSFLTGPDTSTSARLHAEAALGAIWRPLITEPPLDLANAAHQHTSSTPPSPPSNPADPPRRGIRTGYPHRPARRALLANDADPTSPVVDGSASG